MHSAVGPDIGKIIEYEGLIGIEFQRPFQIALCLRPISVFLIADSPEIKDCEIVTLWVRHQSYGFGVAFDAFSIFAAATLRIAMLDQGLEIVLAVGGLAFQLCLSARRITGAEQPDQGQGCKWKSHLVMHGITSFGRSRRLQELRHSDYKTAAIKPEKCRG